MAVIFNSIYIHANKIVWNLIRYAFSCIFPRRRRRRHHQQNEFAQRFSLDTKKNQQQKLKSLLQYEREINETPSTCSIVALMPVWTNVQCTHTHICSMLFWNAGRHTSTFSSIHWITSCCCVKTVTSMYIVHFIQPTNRAHTQSTNESIYER